MDSSQDSLQVQQLPVIPDSPLLQSQGSRYSDAENDSETSSASKISIPAPTDSEEKTETDNREPLKERCGNSSDNQEVPESDQEKEIEEGSIGNDKLNDYVAKVLEKLLQQKEKVSKLSTILEKSGLLSDKNNSQVQKMIQDFENVVGENSNDNTTDKNSPVVKSTKEKTSPVKPRQVAVKSSSPKVPTKRNGEKYTVEEVLEVSRKNICYGPRFPGQIVEEHLEITNTSRFDFVVQIFVNCVNEELQDTDEYVYSVRRSHLYDYNDKHYLIMAPYSCAGFKFALKVPNLKLNGKILGQVKIQVQGMTGSYNLDLSAQVAIPKVFCPKELSCNGLDYKVIKLAVKEGKKQELKIPIRNNGDIPVTLELEFYEPNSSSGAQEKPMFDCMVHPNVITIAPNSQSLTSILIKPWKILMGVEALNKPKSVRKILVGKVRDSALVYSFVFWIDFF